MSVDHYENFPVASWLMPAALRPAIQAIYHFARSSDDLADEGDALSAERLAALQQYVDDLERIAAGATPQLAVVERLGEIVAQYSLPLTPFHDLLSAFMQDVSVSRYANYSSMLDYCSRSANPIGRLMLLLYGHSNAANVAASDQICTGLQIVNFWQDIAIDWKKDRIYLPLDDLHAYGVTEQQIGEQRCNDAWQSLMRFECRRTHDMLVAGAPLAQRLPGRIGFELRLVVAGGLRILEKLDHCHYDMFRHRPVLTKADWLLLAWRACSGRHGR
jgi:squalene synthase HpnC